MLVSVSEQLAGSNAPKHFYVTRLVCRTLETVSRGVRTVTCNIHPRYIDIALIILHKYSWHKVGAKGVEHVPSSQAMSSPYACTVSIRMERIGRTVSIRMERSGRTVVLVAWLAKMQVFQRT